MACRRTVPLALSLCVNPMPSRTTRKSTRTRVADRTLVDTVQPHALASFRNRSALSLLTKMQLLRWNKAKPKDHRTKHENQASLVADKGLDVANHNGTSGGGRNMFLTSLLIDQAIAQSCAVCSPFRGSMSVIAIFRQSSRTRHSKARVHSTVRGEAAASSNSCASVFWVSSLWLERWSHSDM